MDQSNTQSDQFIDKEQQASLADIYWPEESQQIDQDNDDKYPNERQLQKKSIKIKQCSFKLNKSISTDLKDITNINHLNRQNIQNSDKKHSNNKNNNLNYSNILSQIYPQQPKNEQFNNYYNTNEKDLKLQTPNKYKNTSKVFKNSIIYKALVLPPCNINNVVDLKLPHIYSTPKKSEYKNNYYYNSYKSRMARKSEYTQGLTYKTESDERTMKQQSEYFPPIYNSEQRQQQKNQLFINMKKERFQKFNADLKDRIFKVQDTYISKIHFKSHPDDNLFDQQPQQYQKIQKIHTSHS